MKFITSFAAALVAAVNATKIIYLPDVDVKDYQPPRDKFKFSFPWPADDPICGATMVSPQHIVTAAHCITADLQVPFEIPIYGKDGDENKPYVVSEVRPISCWTEKEGETINEKYPSDVAVMVLDSPILNAKEGIDYLKIWDKEEQEKTVENEVFALVGWG